MMACGDVTWLLSVTVGAEARRAAIDKCNAPVPVVFTPLRCVLDNFLSLSHTHTLSPISRVISTMNVLRSGGGIPQILRPCRPQTFLRTRYPIPPVLSRGFHAASSLLGTRSQILKDVGEGKLPQTKYGLYLPYRTNWLLISCLYRHHRGPGHPVVCGGRSTH